MPSSQKTLQTRLIRAVAGEPIGEWLKTPEGKIALRLVCARAVAHGDDLEFKDIFDLAQEDLAISFEELTKTSEGGFQEKSGRISRGNAGSLAHLVRFANAFPVVVKARQNVLGQKENLTLEEAENWVRMFGRVDVNDREFQEHILTLRVRLPYSQDLSRTPRNIHDLLYGAMLGQNSVAALVQALEDAHLGEHDISPSRSRIDFHMYPEGYVYASLPSTWPRSIDGLKNGKRPESYNLDGLAKPARLVEWAKRLVPICGDVELAVWLILAGLWNRRGWKWAARRVPDSESFLDSNLFPFAFWESLRPKHLGTLTLELLELGPEVSSNELKSEYERLRRDFGMGKRGQPISREAEMLGCVAIEVMHITGKDKGSHGFYKAVRDRWANSKDRFHADAKERYTTTESVRQALLRVEKAYFNAYPDKPTGEAHSTKPVSRLFEL